MKYFQITIIYANRDKDLERIEATLKTLHKQTLQNFEVVFVDYGSNIDNVLEYKKLFERFKFVNPFFLEVSQLLWNKSKALNYGIKQARTSTIFIADIDLIFHPEVTKKFGEIATKENFYLFELGYLEKEESEKLERGSEFEILKPSRAGKINGMVLVPTEALLKINGLDEFFHFYGAEDEDLFARLEIAGYKRKEIDQLLFYHNWHPSFSAAEDKKLTLRPRVKNIMRINQQHFLRNRERGVVKPLGQKGMGEIIAKQESELLNYITRQYKVYNIRAKVEHFLGEELPSLKGGIIQVEFSEDPYYRTLKHQVKKLLGKQTQPYCSLKEVNDMLLKEILFRYRNHNYSFKISEDLRSIHFKIKL